MDGRSKEPDFSRKGLDFVTQSRSPPSFEARLPPGSDAGVSSLLDGHLAVPHRRVSDATCLTAGPNPAPVCPCQPPRPRTTPDRTSALRKSGQTGTHRAAGRQERSLAQVAYGAEPTYSLAIQIKAAPIVMVKS